MTPFSRRHCSYCSSAKLSLRCKRARQDGSVAQQWLCRDCGKRFNERTGTPLARLRTSVERVERVLKMRSEGMGIRAAGRVEGVHPKTVARWEARLDRQAPAWSPAVAEGSDVTVEADELYTRVEKNLPASQAKAGR